MIWKLVIYVENMLIYADAIFSDDHIETIQWNVTEDRERFMSMMDGYTYILDKRIATQNFEDIIE